MRDNSSSVCRSASLAVPLVKRLRIRRADPGLLDRHTLAARLGMRELDEISSHVNHAVVVIHDDHAARPMIEPSCAKVS